MRQPRKKGGTLKDGERRQLARTSRHASDAPVAFAPSDRHVLLCDGGSRGNPGTAASAAILVSASGEVIDQHAELIGQASAGEAEYRAILLGLHLAQSHGVEAVEVRSDSQLAISALRSATPAPARRRGGPYGRRVLHRDPLDLAPANRQRARGRLGPRPPLALDLPLPRLD